MTGQHHIKGILFAGTAGILWGISGFAASTLFKMTTTVTPLWLTQIRMVTAGIILLILGQTLGVQPFKLWRRRGDAFQLVCYALLGLVPVQWCYFEAVKYGNAPIATILQFVGPFIISLYFLVFKHIAPTRPETVGMVMAFLGVLLIVTHGHLNQLAISPVVLFWGGLSALGGATNTLLPRPLLPKFGAIAVTGWGLLVAGLCLNIFDPIWQHPVDLSWFGWSMVGVVIFLGTVIPFLMFAHALGYILPTTASLLDAFEPLSATVFSVIFLNVQLTPFDLFGGVLVIMAVMALSLNGHQMLRLFHRFRLTGR